MSDAHRETLIPELPPLSSDILAFDINHELRLTVVDLIRRAEPTTIMGVLLANPNGVSPYEVAERLDRPAGIIGWNLEKLMYEDLCVSFVDADGETKVLAVGADSRRSEQGIELGYRREAAREYTGPSLVSGATRSSAA